MDFPQPDEATLTDVAHRLHVPYRIAHGWLLSGKLDGRRVGTRWYVRESSVAAIEAERAPLAQPA
jgi:hypothetical protein